MLLLAFGTTLSSCWGVCEDCRSNASYTVAEAYLPIYGYDSSKYFIKKTPPRPILAGGKIYVWGNLLFQVEQYQGVHVIDYSDKRNPVKIGFIASKGCTEVAVKGNYLIVNNLTDLVTVDFSNFSAVKEVGRLKGAFPSQLTSWQYEQPSVKGVYYKCPEPNKGDVMGWELKKNVKDHWCHN